jgi:hypothetical protein
MNHEEIQEELPQLIAGTLSPEKEQAVLQHLAQCGECRRELAFWAQVSVQVKSELPAVPKEALQDVKTALFHGGKHRIGLFERLEKLGEVLQVTGEACRLAVSLGGRI